MVEPKTIKIAPLITSLSVMMVEVRHVEAIKNIFRHTRTNCFSSSLLPIEASAAQVS
jgi:hypothetical protein